MALADDLEHAARAAASHGSVSAVLAAEPDSGGRVYLIALGEGDERRWLVLDSAFAPELSRERVRAAASIVVLCELADELAGGGRLEELRARLLQLRTTEQLAGTEAADDAALALEQAIGAPPVVASPAYLDAVGAATRALEQALGEHGSPFADALTSSSGAVAAFVDEVEARHRLPLR
jgi:hypothetical protein